MSHSPSEHHHSERRQHSRIAFHAPAQLILADDRQIDVLVIDLSLKGALIRLPDQTPVPPMQSNALGILHICLDETSTYIRMETKTAHINGQWIGLVCHNIDLESVTHLRHLVELNLGDPALLERELSALLAE